MSRQVLEAFGELGEPYLAASVIPLRIGRIVNLGDQPFAVAREATWEELIAHHTHGLKVGWEMDSSVNPKTHPYCYEFITD